MRHDKLERELDLMLLLTENRGHTTEQICQRLGISRRNFYYYLEFFRDCGFILEKQQGRWSIARTSPFFKRLFERVSFTEDEAVVIRRLIASVEHPTALTRSIDEKLSRFYDFGIVSQPHVDETRAHIASQLYNAIKYRRMAVLRGYSSPHGRSRRDRLVEPFLLMNGGEEVRCYEPASGMNKTFKLARMADVDVLSDEWQHEEHHRQMHTDIFMFSDERWLPVELSLGTLSYHILVEEYPAARPFLMPDGDRWLLRLNVCSYRGIGRFVLGLYSDIRVLGSDDFRRYLKQQIEEMRAMSET